MNDALNLLAANRFIELTRVGRGRGSRLIVSIVNAETPLAVVTERHSTVESLPPTETHSIADRNTLHGATETHSTSAAHREGTEKDQRARTSKSSRASAVMADG